MELCTEFNEAGTQVIERSHLPLFYIVDELDTFCVVNWPVPFKVLQAGLISGLTSGWY